MRVLQVVNRPVKIDPLDDLMFDVYQDPETAIVTRRLNRLKDECIAAEDFLRAKQIKQIMHGAAFPLALPGAVVQATVHPRS